jgi:23S rRNA (cytidine1920-2'-O)/16S rRNA (cytidine1409-2'-O)-methyltransferase
VKLEGDVKKVRLDQLLLERGFFESRSRAQWAIRNGLVSVNESFISKPGEAVDVQSVLNVQDHPALHYVSFGGYKLHTALDAFALNVEKIWALDVGASTGGFTDCLLKRGAQKVLAVDVGKGQLHPTLRHNPKVLYFEEQDFRSFSYSYTASLVTVDVSFISVTLLFEGVLRFLDTEGQALILIKPQFEQNKKLRFKGGIIRNLEIVTEAVAKVLEVAEREGLYVKDLALAPVEEEKNIEVFALFSRLKPAHRMQAIQKLGDWLTSVPLR